MAMDVQNQELAEWLELMGCPLELSQEDLKKMNSGSMRSVWRHLQRHVKPVSTVRIIKKNLLLAKLRTHGSLPGKFGNFKIETVQQLVQSQKHSVTQQEIDFVKGKIREADETLMTATSFLITKLAEKENMICNLQELNEKSALLNLKFACIQSDVEKLDKELEIANVLKTCPAPQTTYLEMKEKKVMVAKFVQTFCSVEITDDCIVEMIVSTSELPPSVTFDGILSVSKNALKALSSTKIADVGQLSKLPNKLNSLSFSKPLTNLNTSLFKNELEIKNCSRKVDACKAELDEERAALRKIMEEAVTSGDCQGLTLAEVSDKVVDNTFVVKREEKLKELLDELQDECSSDFECAKWTLKSYKEKEDDLLTKINEKLSDINKLIDKISTVQVSHVKAGVCQRARGIVSNFLTKLSSHKEEESQCQVLVSENLVGREIEMFHKLPLVAITRQWEESFETIPKTVREDILKAPELFLFLCQSEFKNVLKNIVEKMFWLHTSQYQLND